MLIQNILANPISSLRYMERYVNVGSPSGFTQVYNTSSMTNPMGPNQEFRLFVARFPERMITNLGKLPSFFSGNSMMIHPDMAEDDLITSNCESITLSDIRVCPTSSSRTVDILDPTCQGYLKLNYKGLIGRMDRQITSKHAISGVELTEIIKDAILMNKLPNNFSFFIEPGARVVSIPHPGGEYEWGMVFREFAPFPYSSSFAFMIPAFSLFSKDMNNENDSVLLIQLIERQNQNPDIYLFENIISQLVSCYFELLINCALQLECHAQNALFGFDENCIVKGIVIRDLESIDKDVTLARDLDIKVEYKSSPYKCLHREQYNYKIMHSFMYDFKLGEYILTPLIEVVRAHYGINPDRILNNIKMLSNEYMKKLPNDFFPLEWYYYENIVMDRTKPRPYVARSDLKYR